MSAPENDKASKASNRPSKETPPKKESIPQIITPPQTPPPPPKTLKKSTLSNESPPPKSYRNPHPAKQNLPPGKSPKKSTPKRPKKPPAMKPTFPAQEIFSMLGKGGRGKSKVSPGVSLYLGAVHEYLATEILEMAGNHAVSRGSRTIQTRDVLNAIHTDEELENCLGDVAP